MGGTCKGFRHDKAAKPNQVDEVTEVKDSYRDDVVMESGGTTDFDNKNYVEADDDKNAIAEGYR